LHTTFVYFPDRCSWNFLAVVNHGSDQTAAGVIVFSTPTCPFCARRGKYFRGKGVRFSDPDVRRGRDLPRFVAAPNHPRKTTKGMADRRWPRGPAQAAGGHKIWSPKDRRRMQNGCNRSSPPRTQPGGGDRNGVANRLSVPVQASARASLAG